MANANTSLNGYEFGSNPKTKAPFWAGSGEGAEIDDTVTVTDKTWSSKKISDELAEKADSDAVYTKAQVDELLADIPAVDAYTKTETDELLAGKAAVTSVYTKSQTYTKAEVDNLLSQIPAVDAYTKAQTDSLLADKANASDVYTKSQVDNLIPDVSGLATKTELNSGLATKADADDVYTKTYLDSEFLGISHAFSDVRGQIDTCAKATSVYTKAQTYTKAEVDDLISGATPAPVDAYTKAQTDNLLAAKADVTALADYAKVTSVYMKSETYTKAEVNNLISGVTPTPVDAYTKAQTDALLDEKADATDVYTKTQTDNLLADKADASSVYTKTQTDNLLADKADASSVYTKTQTDNLLADKANSSNVYTKTQTDNLLVNKADLANAMRYDITNSKAQYNNNGTWTDVPEAAASEPLAQRLLATLSNYDIYTGYLLDAKLGITINILNVPYAIHDDLPFSHILDYDAPYKLGGLTGNFDLVRMPIGTKYDSSSGNNVTIYLYVYAAGTYSVSGGGVVDYVAQLNKILNKVVNGEPDGTEEFFRAEKVPLYGVDFYNGSSWISRSFTQTDSSGVQYTEDVGEYEMYTSAGTTFAQKVNAIGWKSNLASGKIYVKRGSSTEWVDVNVTDIKTRYNDNNYDIAINLINNDYTVKAKHYPNYLSWDSSLSEMLEWYS